MIVSYHKEKAYNAIAYFTENTAVCYKKKLFKLLWLLDSEHFQKVGRGVTGYEYQAWQMGPVPVELDTAMKSKDPDLLEWFELEVHGKGPKAPITLRSKRPFEGKYFSKRQLDLIDQLANDFEMTTGEEMERWTHRPGTPWHRVWMVENQKNVVIPFEYALDKLPPEQRAIVLSISQERKAFLAAFE